MDNTRLSSLFFSVDRSGGPNACWLWQGSRTQDGYPQPVKHDGTYWRVHVLVYSLTHSGARGMQVSQRCKNRVCLNPAHLYVEASEPASGAPTPLTPPTPGVPIKPRRLYGPQRAAMREAYRQGATQKALAQEYGVSIGNVHRTVRGARPQSVRRPGRGQAKTTRAFAPVLHADVLALYGQVYGITLDDEPATALEPAS